MNILKEIKSDKSLFSSQNEQWSEQEKTIIENCRRIIERKDGASDNNNCIDLFQDMKIHMNRMYPK